MKKLLTITFLCVLLCGCSDIVPNKFGKFVIISADKYDKGLSKYRVSSVKGVAGFSFVDSSNLYSVGDTIYLSKTK